MIKPYRVDLDKVRQQFRIETGLEPLEVLEAWPVGKSVTVHTENKTFIGWLTDTARIKKGSFKEDC